MRERMVDAALSALLSQPGEPSREQYLNDSGTHYRLQVTRHTLDRVVAAMQVEGLPQDACERIVNWAVLGRGEL